MKFLLTLLLLALSGTRAFSASPPITLEGVLDEGLNRSPRVRQAKAVATEAKWRHVESLGGLLPQLSISANHYFDIKYQIINVNFGPGGPTAFPLILPQSQATLDARVVLFDGFQNIYSYHAAGRAQEAAEFQADWSSFQVREDLTLKFYQALAAQKLALVADQNLKTLEDHLGKVKVRRTGGIATRYDVLRVEVQLDEARSEKMFSEDNVVVSRAKLNEAMGLAEDDRPLLGELPIPKSGNIENLTQIDISTRKDIAALIRQSEAADSKQAAASAYWVPRVSLDYQYSYYNNVDYTFTTPFLDSHAFGIFLNWNLFDGAVSIARHQEAAQQTIQAETASRTAVLKYKTDFEFWKRRYLYSAALYQAKLADVDKAQESVRLASEGFRAGSQTSSDVLDAELELFRTRAGVVTSQVNAAEALVNLELTTGRKF